MVECKMGRVEKGRRWFFYFSMLHIFIAFDSHPHGVKLKIVDAGLNI
jgi:hypothetical protein